VAACGSGGPSNAGVPVGNGQVRAPEAPRETRAATAEAAGKVVDFPHVLALWDSKERALRVLLTTREVPQSEWEDWRTRRDIVDDGKPYVLCMIGMADGEEKFSVDGVAGHNYILQNMTDPKPTSYSNIGPESIRVLSGEMKVGARVRVHIAFRAEEHKFGGDDRVHIDVQQELELH